MAIVSSGLVRKRGSFLSEFLKSRAGLRPSFQPYEDLQHALGNLLGHSVNPWLAWLMSFLNGAVVLGLRVESPELKIGNRCGCWAQWPTKSPGEYPAMYKLAER